MENDVISIILGCFVVALCWRTLVLTLRIENLERVVGLRRGPVTPVDVERKSDGSAYIKVLAGK